VKAARLARRRLLVLPHSRGAALGTVFFARWIGAAVGARSHELGATSVLDERRQTDRTVLSRPTKLRLGRLAILRDVLGDLFIQHHGSSHNGLPLTGEARTRKSNALGRMVARASSGAAAELGGDARGLYSLLMPPDDREIVDPLSPTTRAERKWLLVSSFVLVAVSWGGLAPSKIDAFGLEIGQTRPGVLVGLAATATAYFLCAFYFYYRSDRFVADKRYFLAQRAAGRELTKELRTLAGIPDFEGGKLEDTSLRLTHGTFKRFVRRRYVFEFWSAIGAGLASLLAALTWAVCSA
jgi:hypothetical protein